MLRTHYDTLKIARDAPIEVIRAAYRALTLKYHPDRHGTEPEATEMMALLNGAYDVLSDPDRRREHDEWIRSMETTSSQKRAVEWAGERPAWSSAAEVPEPSGPSRLITGLVRFRHYWLLGLAALLLAFMGSVWYERLYVHRSKALTPLSSSMSAAGPSALSVEDAPAASIQQPPWSPPVVPPDAGHSAAAPKSSSPPPASRPEKPAQKPALATPPSVAQASKQPEQKAPAHPSRKRKALPPLPHDADSAVAPNGEPWPVNSDYVAGYGQFNTDGLSQVVIDNSDNDFDAFVKIVSVGDSEPKAVRTIFIAAGDRFTVSHMGAGTYEVHYQNLTSGMLLRSEVFALEESAIASGNRSSTVTLTLHQMPDDGKNTYLLSKEQF